MPWKYTFFFLMVPLSENKTKCFFPQPIHEYIKFQVMFFSLNTPYCWTSYMHSNTCHLLIDSLRLLQIILCIRSLSTKKTIIFLNIENITSPLKSPIGLKVQHILQIPYPFKLLASLFFFIFKTCPTLFVYPVLWSPCFTDNQWVKCWGNGTKTPCIRISLFLGEKRHINY